MHRSSLGQTSTSAPGASPAPNSILYYLGLTAPETTSEGTYAGGNFDVDMFCNSEIGQALDPSYCAIPSAQQIQANQTAELATTAAPASVEQQAVNSGTAAVTAACTADPSDCAAQAAASLYPNAAAFFGPSLVASFMGVQPNGTVNMFAGFGLYGALILGGLLIAVVVKK